MDTSGWFGVRCVFAFGGSPDRVYEERVTVWQASGPDEAITLAESDAEDYAQHTEAEYLGLAQVYTMSDDLRAGAEVFSLMRTSRLGPAQYVDAFFATGAEHHTIVEA